MRRIIAYLPVIIWMFVIFMASTDIGSSRHTSRIIGPLLRWLNPNVTEETISTVQAVVRKSGHISEYALLAALVWRARRITLAKTGWHRSDSWVPILVCAAYAASDELHQLFVSSRQASAFDVLIDTTGACVGVLIIWALGRWRKVW
ncbi:MAG TPA: VanZ family protein [Verrucomicrobiae bacterium]|nr:VanZ family protein [Verrucomicrobiae bacterium]